MVSRWGCLGFLAVAACQIPVATTRHRDASFSRGERYEVTVEEPPRVVDGVVAELLRAASEVQTVEQRVLCENIANVTTPGYKRRVVHTTTEQIVGPDGDTFTLPVIVRISSVFTTGTLELTQRCLDVAIDGEGFFAVTLPDGSTGYTRDGSLHLNADGKLVTGAGAIVLPEITVPGDTLEISIDLEGLVSGRTAGSPDSATVFGQLTLHRYINPEGMRVEGAMWRPTEASGQPITGQPGLTGLGLLKQGFVERGNVQLGSELLALQLLEKRVAALDRLMQQFGLDAY